MVKSDAKLLCVASFSANVGYMSLTALRISSIGAV
jgi:hypothetical protein